MGVNKNNIGLGGEGGRAIELRRQNREQAPRQMKEWSGV